MGRRRIPALMCRFLPKSPTTEYGGSIRRFTTKSQRGFSSGRLMSCSDAVAVEPIKMKTRERIRPLLVIDGDSLAHRAYHGLPKTIVLGDGRGAGAIVAFANFLLLLYEIQHPLAVLVGWDTLDAPTYRQKPCPEDQIGRHFDDSL